MKTSKEILIEKINDKTAIIGVIGLGYVGLPFAVETAKAGFKVLGIEQVPKKVEKINQGLNYINDVTDADLAKIVKQGLFEASTNFDCLPVTDVIVICVPTPLTQNLTPDLQYVKAVTTEISHSLRKGQLVALESTTYPGTTEEILLPILLESGLKVETDFFLAHSPERIDPGNKNFKIKNTNKIVGGVGEASLETAIAFYSQAIDRIIPVSCAKVAELAKVFENTFRAVNIALVNEMTLLCNRMGINVWEVLDAAFTKPYGLMAFYPGPGVGGHCIPIDPHYLEWKSKEYNFETHFIALAGEINRKMPEYVEDKAIRLLNQAGIASSQARVLITGAAYKKDVSDYRQSPAIEIMKLLLKDGVDVIYHDPLIPQLVINDRNFESYPLTEDILASCDLTLIVTDHSLTDYQWIVEKSNLVFDTRNVTKAIGVGREKITLL